MKLTIEDLVARSLQSDLDKYKAVKIVIDDDGNYIMAEKKDIKTVSRIIDDSGKNAEENAEQTAMLIYAHCKILHNEELRKNYGVIEPVEVVEKVFMSNMELMEKAAAEIMTMYGLNRKEGNREGTVDAVETVKN
jgi:hypothetical protein